MKRLCLTAALFLLPILSAGAMTPAQLQKATAYWQQRLGLTEWSVTAALADSPAIPKEAAGMSRADHENYTVTIYVLSDKGYRQRGWTANHRVYNDQVDTLVHEMMHVVLDAAQGPIEQHSREGFEREMLVDRLTKVILWREKRGK